MEPRTLLRALPELVRPLLSAELRAFRSGAPWSYLVKVYYGNADLHYEASHRPKLRTIEIGLHFEADDLTNARLLGAFRTHERAIHRELLGARLREWDKGWTRIWEAVAYERLDEVLQRDLAARLARYIAVLEPILRAELPADVPWHLPTERTMTGGARAADREATRTRTVARRRRARA